MNMYKQFEVDVYSVNGDDLMFPNKKVYAITWSKVDNMLETVTIDMGVFYVDLDDYSIFRNPSGNIYIKIDIE